MPNPKRPTKDAHARLICGDCGKEVAEGKPRSNVTRFLFHESRCKCIQKDIVQAKGALKVSDTIAGAIETGAPESDGEFDKAAVEARLDGQYEIISLLGRGGMGAVYLAKHKEIGQEFAVKLLNPDLDKSKQAQRRFSQESLAASKLTHPNLVAIYDYGVSKAGSSYLVMDYLEGTDLATLLKREGPLDQDRALPIFQQIVEALAHAHERGVVHRDIKPENILITRAGELDIVKIVDFGIAKDIAHQRATQQLTQTGEIFGSPMYMSPEQCLGNEQDARSDIYSLGCVMYEMLTGAPPFTGQNPVSIILKQVTQDASPPQAVPPHEISPSLSAIIMHCLEKVPENRYQSATDLFRDIDKVAAGGTVTFKRRPKARQPNRPSIWVISAALMVLAAASAAWFVNSKVDSTNQALSKHTAEELVFLGDEARKKYMGTLGISKAITYYEAAINGGSEQAMVKLGDIFANDSFPSDERKARSLYMKALEAGSVEAGTKLANLSLLRNNYAQAAHWLQVAVDRGDAPAFPQLAELYINGKGVPVNLQKAKQLLESGVKHNDLVSCGLLGYMYEYGLGMPRDYKKALALYKQGAALGSNLARLGHMYRAGHGVPVDFNRAIEYYEQSINHNSSNGAVAIADMYSEGQGVPKDLTKALEYYLKAANRLNPRGSIGVYSTLAKLKVDLQSAYPGASDPSIGPEEAVNLLKLESQDGDPEPSFLLAKLYLSGDQVKKDRKMAIEYLQRAADRNYDPAVDLLKRLQKN